MQTLKKDIAKLEATHARVFPPDPLEALRQWRLEALKNHVRRAPALAAAAAKAPRK